MHAVEHLLYLYETESLREHVVYEELMESYEALNGMLFSFIESVDEQHDPAMFLREEQAEYGGS